MIFNMNESFGGYAVNMDAIQESPYALGLEGALMHVYENELNYNALMKAVGLSEMKYYQETGGDLFVNEAGALGGFIDGAKKFFKKVIEKIAQIAKKFFAKINSYVMDEKTFVKKYEKELIRRDLTGMKFTGWTFPEFSLNLASADGMLAITTNDSMSKDAGTYRDVGDNVDDKIEKKCNVQRGRMLNSNDELTEEEFRTNLHDKLYGDTKEEFDVSIRDALNTISNAKKAISNIETQQKKYTNIVNKFITYLEKIQSTFMKVTDDEKKNTDDAKEISDKKNNAIKELSVRISTAKAYSNDLTVAFGMQVQAENDKNRQAKAICVKALSYKHESAVYYGGGNDDIFAGVVIR
jgi:hypothetical protein